MIQWILCYQVILMESYKKLIIKNILFTVVFVILFTFSFTKCVTNNDTLECIEQFIVNRSDDLSDFLEVCIGIYVAVVSILASQKTSLTVKISENSYDKKFVISIAFGLVLNLLTVFCLFIIKIRSFVIFLASLCIVSSIYFFRFLIYLVIMFSDNMSVIKNEAAEEKKYKEDLLSEIEEIRKKLSDL